MGRILFSVILLVLLTVLIVLNLSPTTSVNLFGAKFQNVPVVAVALLSFALGVVYSFVLYVGQYFHRTSRERLAKRHQDIQERERELAATDDRKDIHASDSSRSGPPAQEAPARQGETPPRRSALSKLWDKLR